MRDYAKVEPKAWHGQTFKVLRKGPSEGLVVAFYLMTSPSSNMLGLYVQPILYMAHETGLGLEGATKGLKACIEGGFCSYDHDTEVVWVHEMASYQIGSELKASDLRCKGVQRDYDALADNPFLGPFFDKYASSFHLTSRREKQAENKGPSKPLTKPLRSQEQEQEKEQEKEKDTPQPPKGGCRRFEEFWTAWPKSDRRQDKVKCAEKWRRNGFDALADTILADIAVRREGRKWLEDGGKFIEAPLTYLNGKRWEDGADVEREQEQFV